MAAAPRSKTMVRALTYVMYGAFVAAGVAQVVAPSRVVSSSIGLLVYVWCLFIIVGGISGLAGLASRFWFLESAGLLLLSVMLMLYGLAAVSQAHESATLFSSGMLFIGFSAALFGKWAVGAHEDRVARAVVAAKDDEEGSDAGE